VRGNPGFSRIRAIVRGTGLAVHTGMAKISTHTIRCDVPVFFATTEGQTRRIAERLAEDLRDQGLTSQAFDVNSPEAAALDWSRVRGALLGASLHMQRHQRRAYRFVGKHVDDLNRVPTGFFSVSLAAASADPDEKAAAFRLAESFPDHQGWKPSMVLSVAGRLAYTKYGFFTKRIMQAIARKEGAPVDASRDYELTNWEKVDRLAMALAGVVKEHAAQPQIAAA
jgi:menaquinone-dependent protoporphyrinogen oxidase